MSLLLAVCTKGLGQGKQNVQEYVSEFIQEYVSFKYPSVKLDTLLYVGVVRQEMYLIINGVVKKTYQVSTSRTGAGTKSGSNQTPIGLHRVNGKFGKDVPYGGILKARKYTGSIAEIEEDTVVTGRDEITSRVITIKGMEKGINRGGENDSYNRKIYIHGTAEEGLIGQPASHGCIRMKNLDVIELFDTIHEGVPLLILDN